MPLDRESKVRVELVDGTLWECEVHQLIASEIYKLTRKYFANFASDNDNWDEEFRRVESSWLESHNEDDIRAMINNSAVTWPEFSIYATRVFKPEVLDIDAMRYHVFPESQVQVISEPKKVKQSHIPASELDISKNGIDFIKKWEGFSSTPYTDGGGVLTIGYGHTKTASDYLNKPPITEEEGLELLAGDIKWAVNAVRRYVSVVLTQNQFDALVSFTFNVGEFAFRRSTLLKKLNKLDYTGAGEEFKRWIYDNGKIVRGLQRRRQEELKLFLT